MGEHEMDQAAALDKPLSVLGISGSPRKGGNTQQLLEIALEVIGEAGINTELVSLHGKTIGPCIACYQCRESRIANCAVQDDFQEIFAKTCSADGLILASPVYFGSMTGAMKCLMERLGMVSEGREAVDISMPDSRWYEAEKAPGLFARKVGASLVAARRDGTNVVHAELSLWFLINNFVIVGANYWPAVIGGTRTGGIKAGGDESANAADLSLTKSEVEHDFEGVAATKVMASNLVWVLQRLAAE
ncbi:flavodoxin family protein [Candidatus Bipolaricaulota bacterium]